jgi:hypothetical protein
MVLSEALTGEVRFGVLGAGLRTIYTWLQGLSRPEDINDVDEDGTTVLSRSLAAAAHRRKPIATPNRARPRPPRRPSINRPN